MFAVFSSDRGARLLLLVSLSVSAVLAKPAALLAQGALTLPNLGQVQNNAVVTSEGYYQQTISRNCNASFCTATFSAIPAKKTLVLNYVGCVVTASGTSPMTEFSLRASDNIVFAPLVPLFVGTDSGGLRKINSSNQMLQVVRAGVKPIIVIVYTSMTQTSMGCSIAGQLKP
jgi:hypothetical protein